MTHANESHLISAWRFSDAVHSWDWKGCDGMEAVTECRASFRTAYEKGELLAVALDENGCETGRDVLVSGNDLEQLLLIPDKETIAADRQALLYVDIAVTDEAGVVHSADDTQFTVCVEGCGTLAGFGNAEPFGPGCFSEDSCRTYYGRA